VRYAIGGATAGRAKAGDDADAVTRSRWASISGVAKSEKEPKMRDVLRGRQYAST